jgi:hypothetical protein
MINFETLRLITASICVLLAYGWLFWPRFILWLWQVKAEAGDIWAARRGGALFAGLAVILVGAKGSGSEAQALSYGLALACLILASLGLLAFFQKKAGPLIWVAIVVELALVCGFILIKPIA